VENRRWGDVEREELEVWKFDRCEPSVILCAVGGNKKDGIGSGREFFSEKATS
jgi:hypothetical protein